MSLFYPHLTMLLPAYERMSVRRDFRRAIYCAMQYKRLAMPIARGKVHKSPALPMFLRSARCAVVLLPVLMLAGCADALPSGKSLRELVRSYDNTLTSSEKKAAITELQQDKERQQQELARAEAASKGN